jgi:hypothetical protein
MEKERKLPLIVEEMAQLPDEELCLMMDEEIAWMFGLPPHEEAHPAPYIGNQLFTLYTEIVRRLRRYSRQSKI